MTLFRKSLASDLGGRAQRIADALRTDHARELMGTARQYVGQAGDVASQYAGKASSAVGQYAGQAGNTASQYAGHAGSTASEYAGQLGSAASRYAGQLSGIASKLGKRASKSSTRVGKQASTAAALAGKQVRNHPRTSIAVGAGLGIAALTAAWLLRRHHQRELALMAHDEHDPTRYRASNDAGDALDGSGEDNPVPGESGLY